MNLVCHSFLVAKKSAIIITLLLILFGCNQQPQLTKTNETNTSDAIGLKTVFVVSEKAYQIAKQTLITDTHIDLPYRLEEKYEDISDLTKNGDFDYSRAIVGGLNAPFMSIYIPAELEAIGGSKELADKLIDGVEAIVNQSPNKFQLANSVEQMQNNFARGIISLPMGMENGAAIEGKMENLRHFYDRGIRYITLTHSKANHISDSSYDENRPAKGLTEFGKKLVLEMNNIGIMVDVSHISDEAFYQVMEISQVPVIASHSSARHFTPGFERNMSDEMIKLLAKNGGLIQINFGSTFISQKSIENYNLFKAARAAFIKQNNVTEESEEVKAFTKKYREEIPFEYASLNDVLDHFDHVKNLVGIDYVGIGSDYDGVGDSLPTDLKDVAAYPNLIQGLMDRNYSEQEITKILSGNLIRVWQQTEAFAEEHKLTQIIK